MIACITAFSKSRFSDGVGRLLNHHHGDHLLLALDPDLRAECAVPAEAAGATSAGSPPSDRPPPGRQPEAHAVPAARWRPTPRTCRRRDWTPSGPPCADSSRRLPFSSPPLTSICANCNVVLAGRHESAGAGEERLGGEKPVGGRSFFRPSGSVVERDHARPLVVRPIEGGVLHAERIEDALLQELVERLAGDNFDDAPQRVDAGAARCTAPVRARLKIERHRGQASGCTRPALSADLRGAMRGRLLAPLRRSPGPRCA